jgi:hypothetical protein
MQTPSEIKVFLLLFLQKKKILCSFLKKRTKRLLLLRGFKDPGFGRRGATSRRQRTALWYDL